MGITRADLDYIHMTPGDDYDPELVAAIVREGTGTTSAERPFGCQGCGVPSKTAHREACHLAIGGVPLYG